jgi:hypothetical protein
MPFINLQHVRIGLESCVSVEQGDQVAMIFDLADAKNERAPHLLLTAFLRTL